MTVAVRPGARLRAGRYELERLLGRGGAASVWLARDTLLERPVAVKVLAEGLADDRDWLARFRREARVAAQLQHPNLVSVYDFEAEAERPYLVMAYVPGGTLAARLENGGLPDPRRLAYDLLRALEHIHAAGIVHRDVKPANVLLDRDGRACLTDFGIARPEDATSITQTGHIPGTARYMAPELWRGEPATERSDLFSLGVVLSQCLGEQTPAGLVGLVERLAAEDPELRPESATAALELLEGGTTRDATPTAPTVAAAREPTTPARAAAPPPGGTLSRHGAARRWPALAALAAVALAVGVAIAGALGGDADEFDRAAERAQRADSRERDEGGQRPAREAGEGSGDATPVASREGGDPALGAELNDQGYALIQEGRYDEAVPVLQRAVDAFGGETSDLNYAYALFNLGHALRMAGRPAEAIPILEQRLEIPNQQDVVAAELEQARADLEGEDEGKPPKEPKGKGKGKDD